MDGRLMLGFVVLGDVASQGSKNGFAIYRGSAKKGTREFTGRIAIVETGKDRLDSWREAIKCAARDAVGQDASASEFPLQGPVKVRVTFSLNGPRRIPAERLGWPCVKPDVDKYVRGALDALTMSGIWGDDGQAVVVNSAKVYRLLPEPGAVFELYQLPESSAEVVKDQIRYGEVFRRFAGVEA